MSSRERIEDLGRIAEKVRSAIDKLNSINVLESDAEYLIEQLEFIVQILKEVYKISRFGED